MAESLFVKANEVAEVLGVSRAEAYRILNSNSKQISLKNH